MKFTLPPVRDLALGLALAALVAAIPAQAQVGLGKRLFRANCSSCHGEDGQGKGWLSEYLTQRPANLTLFARRNRGVFPADDVRAKVDGRVEVLLHGPRDMPIWSQEYEETMSGSSDPAAGAARRVDAVVDYVRTIQK